MTYKIGDNVRLINQDYCGRPDMFPAGLHGRITRLPTLGFEMYAVSWATTETSANERFAQPYEFEAIPAFRIGDQVTLRKYVNSSGIVLVPMMRGVINGLPAINSHSYQVLWETPDFLPEHSHWQGYVDAWNMEIMIPYHVEAPITPITYSKRRVFDL